ncbi:hypothetical protein E6C76_01420 [Pseudothauera nasutitermitis]|uniref:Uncharacterized protein n=1 Tax=Pseudothauera nasutitermitis TaxID=2565930 RepID=A0A4S4B3E2_9RHOO|nr:hypothetical protein [Pseudothauera nasutitermitis]THF67075.1 hypothetical protein E6C76_01420 [Pseudothauera nasutitermitis]
MSNLEDDIARLVSDYLIKQFRSGRGRFDHTKQAAELIRMISTKHISGIFSQDENRHSSSYQTHRERLGYEEKLEILIKNHSENSIEWADRQKKSVFEKAVSDFLERIGKEFETTTSAREAWQSKERIAELEAQIEFGKPAAQVTFWDRLNTRINLPYMIILCLSVVLIGGLTIIGLNASMTVNVEFNVGEILGALLVGTGVAAAGVSYATRDRIKPPQDREQ